MNFRIDLPDELVRNEVRKRNYKALQARDQLLNAKVTNSILNRFSEGLLNFDPTYKYDD